MENYRDDVIVIFAGYPDKMERFLEKNEGLRSRIAFHVDFPDYNAEELCGILKLMSKEKGYIGIALAKQEEKICPYEEAQDSCMIPAPPYLQMEPIDVRSEELF